MNRDVLFLYAEEPLHPGEEPGVSDVDLPVQRESTTGLLKIASSGLRRAFRAPFQDGAHNLHERILFGSTLRRLEGPDFGHGILGVPDARILLLPVRTTADAFVWVTSPLCVARLRRAAGQASGIPWFDPLREESVLVGSIPVLGTPTARLDEYAVTTDHSKTTEVDTLAEQLREKALPHLTEYLFWREWLIEKKSDGSPGKSRLVVVSDSLFTELCRTGCEVSTHVRISAETGTVEPGALWTQEDVPQDSLFFTVVDVDTPPQDGCPDKFMDDGKPSADLAFTFLRQDMLPSGTPLQIGGDEGLGRGYIRIRWMTG